MAINLPMYANFIYSTCVNDVSETGISKNCVEKRNSYLSVCVNVKSK